MRARLVLERVAFLVVGLLLGLSIQRLLGPAQQPDEQLQMQQHHHQRQCEQKQQPQHAGSERGWSSAGSDPGRGWRDLRATLTVSDVGAFAGQHADGNESPVRICLVTSAISGPTLNGGIATAFFSMARHLAATRRGGIRDFQVTVLYAAHPYYGQGTAEEWARQFREWGITFVPLPESARRHYGPKYVVRSYLIFEYLREREGEFDVITYHDHMGNGYFTALAKSQGLAFGRTTIFVQCHSTVRWADELNHRPPKDHNTLGYYFMEQRALELADARVSPSRYYLEWMVGEGRFNLSRGDSFVVQNLLFPPLSDRQAVSRHTSRHFVFLARLEVRKGLMVLCDALDRLVARADPAALPTAVSFLGPDVSIDGKRASLLLRQRADRGKWPFKVLLQHRFGTDAAIQYIREHGAVVLLPTLGDNSPYTIMELVANELPLITTDAGGGRELLRVPADDTVSIVPAGDAGALAAAMVTAMQDGIRNLAMATPFSESLATYLELLHAFRHKAHHRSPGAAYHPHRRVTVGITSHNRPASLVQAVASIVKQTYPSRLLKVVVVDDASDAPGMDEALATVRDTLANAQIELEVVRHRQHTFVANTRNLILERGATDNANYVCFMDDDDVALPYMLSVYMRVAEVTAADVLTDFSDNYKVGPDGETTLSHRSVALGNAFAHNFFINNYGKANFCADPVRALAVGGHQTGQQSNSPYVDWGFFTRASLHNLRIEVVPLALYKYSTNSPGSIWFGRRSVHDRYNGHGKILRDVVRDVPERYRDLLTYCRYRLGVPTVVGDGPL